MTKVYYGSESHIVTKWQQHTQNHETSYQRVEGIGHILFVDNFFSSSALFYDLDSRTVEVMPF